LISFPKKIHLNSSISKLPEKFENLPFDSLSNISASGIAKILEFKSLKIESLDSLFEFLLEYSIQRNYLFCPLFFQKFILNIYMNQIEDFFLNFFEH
jgi:hypothetical protein